jgi:hypothetical protein
MTFVAPAFPLLPIEDVAADLPIQKDEFPVVRADWFDDRGGIVFPNASVL